MTTAFPSAPIRELTASSVPQRAAPQGKVSHSATQPRHCAPAVGTASLETNSFMNMSTSIRTATMRWASRGPNSWKSCSLQRKSAARVHPGRRKAQCEQWLGLTDWNRVSILENILQREQRAPFSGQSGNAEQVARLRSEIAETRQRPTSDAAAQAQQIYLRALARARTILGFCTKTTQNFWRPGTNGKRPSPNGKKFVSCSPFFYFPYYALGLDLKDAGALAEARATLLKAAALGPYQGDVRLELGIVCGRQGD